MATRIVLEFEHQAFVLTQREYEPFLAELKQLHSFPQETWIKLPQPLREEGVFFSRLLDGLPSKLDDDSPQHEVRYVEDVLNSSFRNGRLLWPEGPVAKEVKRAKQRSQDAALSTLLRALFQVRENITARKEETSNQHNDGIADRVLNDPRFKEFLAEAERRTKTIDEHFSKSRSDLEEVRQFITRDRKDYQSQFSKMAAELQMEDRKREAEAQEARLAAQKWFSDKQATFTSLSDGLTARAHEINASLAGWLKEKESEINGAKEALRTSFATESAHTYWATNKFNRHSDLAISTRRIGCIYLTVVAAMAGLSLFLGSHLVQPLWQTPLSIAIPVAVLVVVIIWVGRILGRTYMAHIQLAEDAKERATMIETYIALIRADVIDKAKAEEAQKALFRPASAGLLAGDSGPDTPIEVITKAVSGSR